MTESQLLQGVVVVDKPIGPTSFDIVRQARMATGTRKVGHGGTLDPLASGVLPLCFGEATKLAQFLLDADKEYEAVVRFGAETDTYDAAGTVSARRPAGHLRAEDVAAALVPFLGEQHQIPPMYSALKRDGRPLYSYARAGETVAREPRTIRIHGLELEAFGRLVAVPLQDGSDPGATDADGPDARILVRSSKGTYVRSLAHDLGQALGTGAHLIGLRRVRSGPFTLQGAIAPDHLGRPPLPVVALADALGHLPSVVVSEDVARELTQGKPIAWLRAGAISPGGAGGQGAGDANANANANVRLLAGDGQLVAVARAQAAGDELIRTMRVFLRV